jgi:hypothetical protein
MIHKMAVVRSMFLHPDLIKVVVPKVRTVVLKILTLWEELVTVD